MMSIIPESPFGDFAALDPPWAESDCVCVSGLPFQFGQPGRARGCYGRPGHCLS